MTRQPDSPEPLTAPCQYVVPITGGACGAAEDAPIHHSGWHGARYDQPVHDFIFRDRRVSDRRVARSEVQSDLRAAANLAIDQLEVIIEAVETGGDIPTEAQIAVNALRAALVTDKPEPPRTAPDPFDPDQRYLEDRIAAIREWIDPHETTLRAAETEALRERVGDSDLGR